MAKQNPAVAAFLKSATGVQYAKLQGALDYLAEKFPVLAECPPVIVTINAFNGSEKYNGMFYPGRFQQDGVQINELAISSRRMNRPLPEIHADMAFRMLTGVQIARGNHQGKKYNAHYVGQDMADLAKSIGLQTHSTADDSKATGQRCTVSIIPDGLFAKACTNMPEEIKAPWIHQGYPTGQAKAKNIKPGTLSLALGSNGAVKVNVKFGDVPEVLNTGFVLTDKAMEMLIAYSVAATEAKQAVEKWVMEYIALHSEGLETAAQAA